MLEQAFMMNPKRPAPLGEKVPEHFPAPGGDARGPAKILNADEYAAVMLLRVLIDARIAPLLTDDWMHDCCYLEPVTAAKDIVIDEPEEQKLTWPMARPFAEGKYFCTCKDSARPRI